MVTYGDGVGDVDLAALLAFHRSQKKLATITAVHPPARFGELTFRGDTVSEFKEKPQIGEGWINGGFMVFEPGVFDFMEGDQTILEKHTLERLAAAGELAAYRHEGFWQCMDSLRDKRLLEGLWQGDAPPWRVW
jgi:glucose-1-phosphate cytidylyltransferase